MSTHRRPPRPALLALLAALPLTAGFVLAASATTPSTPRTQSQSIAPGTQTRTSYADVYLQKLAAALGISVDRLKAAAVSAGNATIDQAVQAGDLTQDRATRMKQRWQNAPLNFGFGKHGGPGRGDGRHGRGDHGQPGDMTPGNQNQPGNTQPGNTSPTSPRT